MISGRSRRVAGASFISFDGAGKSGSPSLDAGAGTRSTLVCAREIEHAKIIVSIAAVLPMGVLLAPSVVRAEYSEPIRRVESAVSNTGSILNEFKWLWALPPRVHLRLLSAVPSRCASPLATKMANCRKPPVIHARLLSIMSSQLGTASRTPEQNQDTLIIERRHDNGPWTVEIGNQVMAHRVVLHSGEQLIVGSAADADIRVQDPSVSAHHCALDATHDAVQIVDLDSRNGVFVGNVQVRAAQLVSRSQAIVVGNTTLILRPGRPRDDSCTAEPVPGLIGNSEPMLRVAAAIRKHAALNAPVLLVGESGVGKDVAARAIHQLSRRSGEYCPINVATIPEALADSELFGHMRGSFTGALSNRSGAFVNAHRGTILLDEIGELPLHIQAKLLRVVEDGVVRPVGGNASQTVDVRLISASWVPLMERVIMGAFRFDLLQRLSTVVIDIPPLRKRKSDIPALVHCWATQHESEIGTKTFASAALARLVAYDWPGNIRELWAVLYRACTNAHGVEVDWPDIDAGIQAGIIKTSLTCSDPSELLVRYKGNISMAARAAGVPRSTFRSRLAKKRESGRQT